MKTKVKYKVNGNVIIPEKFESSRRVRLAWTMLGVVFVLCFILPYVFIYGGKE